MKTGYILKDAELRPQRTWYTGWYLITASLKMKSRMAVPNLAPKRLFQGFCKFTHFAANLLHPVLCPVLLFLWWMKCESIYNYYRIYKFLSRFVHLQQPNSQIVPCLSQHFSSSSFQGCFYLKYLGITGLEHLLHQFSEFHECDHSKC